MSALNLNMKTGEGRAKAVGVGGGVVVGDTHGVNTGKVSVA